MLSNRCNEVKGYLPCGIRRVLLIGRVTLYDSVRKIIWVLLCGLYKWFIWDCLGVGSRGSGNG